MSGFSIEHRPVHLAPEGGVVVQPLFTGEADWFFAYDDRHAADGSAGRLVSCHVFSESWTSWEMHPAGDELVLCIGGGLTVIQCDAAGTITTRIDLGPGDYAVNPAGVWHTADVDSAATVLFITPGSGTTHRPRLPG